MWRKVKVIRTGLILDMQLVDETKTHYKIKFSTGWARWYKKTMFHGSDPVYEFQ